jgi:hypothetical protein
MDKTDLKGVADKVLNKATDYSGSKSRKAGKSILAVVIVILLGALGLEATNNDFDLGKLMNGASMSEAKVMRDKEGNVVTNGSGKATDEYNCTDFTTQPQAQRFFTNAGGVGKDTNRLDGNSDGIACQDLPKGTP